MKVDTVKHLSYDFLKKFPNSNWKQWFQFNYDRNPESFTEDMKSNLEHYCGMSHIPDIADVRFTLGHSFEEGIGLLKAAEDNYIERIKDKRNFAECPITAKKVLDFGDGMTWWDLGKPYCEAEGKAMGHCGNKASHKSYHTILSLRKEYELGGKKYYEPHLTFILDKEHGVLGEMKGRVNEKPSPKYHHHIKELLKQPFIKMIGGGGYKPENNFCFSDLTLEHQKEVLGANPGLIYDTKSDDNLRKILVLFKGSRYCNLRDRAAKEADLSKIDSAILEDLINSHKPIGLGLASNPTLPYHLMELLAEHTDQAVRHNLAKIPGLPDHLVEKLANDKVWFVRKTIAEREDITLKVTEILSQDNNLDVILSLASRPSLPGHLIEKIAARSSSFQHCEDFIHKILASNPNTPVHLMEKYAGHENYAVRLGLAQNSNLPDHLIEKLANDSNDIVRYNLAERLSLPEHLIEKLAGDPDNTVRSGLAKRPDLPDRIIEKLASDNDWSIRRAIAKRQDITPKAMKILSQDNNFVVFSLASNPNLPPHLFNILENSNRNEVKDALERNPSYIKWKVEQKSKQEAG